MSGTWAHAGGERHGYRLEMVDGIFPDHLRTVAINDALGFKVMNTQTEWQADVEQVLQGASTCLPG